MSFSIIVDGPQLCFSSAHFIVDHVKCSRIHGHNFQIRVKIQSEKLNDKKFVLDFIDVKKVIMKEMEELDHKILIPALAKNITINMEKDFLELKFSGKRYIFPREDTCLLPLEAITSEMLAYHFHQILSKNFGDFSISVRIGETSSSYAEVGY